MNMVCSHIDCVQMPAPNFASLARGTLDTAPLYHVEYDDFFLQSLRVLLKPFLFWR